MYSSVLKTYKRTDLESASKTDVLDRLFGRLESDLRDGQRATTAGDLAGRAAALNHASRILAELIAALDHGSAPELCANLEALYRYCLNCITRAMLERSGVPLEQSLGVVVTLRAAFAEAATAAK